MFDLLGFWFVVSLCSVLLLIPVFYVVWFLARHFTQAVTEDKTLAKKVGNWIWATHSKTSTIVFNRFVIYDGINVPATIISVITWLFYLIKEVAACTEHLAGGHPSLVEDVSTIATTLAPYIGSLVVCLLIYIATVYCGRKFWKLKVKVDEIIEKTSD